MRINLNGGILTIDRGLFSIYSNDGDYIDVESDDFKIIIGDDNFICTNNALVIGERNSIRGDRIVCIGSFVQNALLSSKFILLNMISSCHIRKLNEFCYNTVFSELSNDRTKIKYKNFTITYGSINNIQREEYNIDHPCVICYANRVDIVLLNCGHARYCSQCIENIMKNNNGKCPECRNNIKRVHKIYL